MEIKQLDRDDIKQKKAFSELMGYCFKMCDVKDFEKDWDSFVPEVGTIMGSWDSSELASAIMISHRKIMVNGQSVEMDGLGGVATAPTYRKGGVCSELIKAGIENMYEAGAVFSALAPFSYPFYEKLGWKWSYNYLNYAFSMSELSSFKAHEKLELIKENNQEELKAFYKEKIKGINGIADRKQWNWEKRFELAPYRVVVKDKNNQVVGYMLYDICQGQSTFKVWELQYNKRVTLETLFSYIYNHCGQVDQVEMIAPEHHDIMDTLKNPRVECRKHAHMMLRIIDVEKALKTYVYQKDGCFTIEVKDEVCHWNNKVLKVIVKDQRIINIEETVQEAEVTIDIRELVQVIIGFRTLGEVEHQGQLEGYFKEVGDKVVLLESF